MRKLFWGTLFLVIATASWARAGEFKVAYPEVSNPDFKEYREELRKEKTLESIADDLNSVLKIPSDVTLTYEECDEENAFYSPEDHKISICYEMIDGLYDTFSKAGFKDDELDRKVWNDVDYSFYHELGHALIHILDLPVTGKEEDAADQLSIYVLLDGSAEGEQAVLDSAIEFYLRAKETVAAGQTAEDKELDLSDEHSMDAQRFFNLICWVYGENPGKYADLIKQGYLPEPRAARCPDEWKKIDMSWSKLLGPSIKEQESGADSKDQDSNDDDQ